MCITYVVLHVYYIQLNLNNGYIYTASVSFLILGFNLFISLLKIVELGTLEMHSFRLWHSVQLNIHFALFLLSRGIQTHFTYFTHFMQAWCYHDYTFSFCNTFYSVRAIECFTHILTYQTPSNGTLCDYILCTIQSIQANRQFQKLYCYTWSGLSNQYMLSCHLVLMNHWISTQHPIAIK